MNFKHVHFILGCTTNFQGIKSYLDKQFGERKAFVIDGFTKIYNFSYNLLLTKGKVHKGILLNYETPVREWHRTKEKNEEELPKSKNIGGYLENSISMS